LFDGVVFCSTAHFFLLSVEGTLVEEPLLCVTTACKVRFFSIKIEKTTQKYCFVVRYYSHKVSIIDNLAHYTATICRLCSSKKLNKPQKECFV